MIKSFLAVSPLLALLVLAACSSRGSDVEDTTEDELHGSFCGGIAAIRCPRGKVCKLSGHHPDASGSCVAAVPGEQGSLCGGSANVQCKAGFECELEVPEEDESLGPPPGAVGLPIPVEAGAGGPPPGAVGMPLPPAGEEGEEIEEGGDEDANAGGPPAGAVGMPIMPRLQGTCVRKHSGPPPGAVGMPIHP